MADIVGAAPSPVADAYRVVRQAQRQRGPLPMPGRSTPWAGVISLTANVALEVEGRRLRRIFPRGGLPAMDAPSAAAAIGPRLRGQVETLVASGRPVALSVTAGRDSRVSLAASRPYRDAIQYLTYAGVGPAGNDWDVTTARSMSAALGLSHRVLELTGVDDAPGLRQALSEASILSHSAEVVGAYRRSFPGDTIHIRSNIFEIARSYYRRKASRMAMPTSPRALTPAQLASLWGRRAPVSPLVVEAFDEWMQAVGFTDVTEIDGLDMFYWEHRMAGWHSNVVLESDFAFDSHVLFNARTILRDMLAVPADDRARSTVSEQLVADLWPELQRWPYKDPTGTRPLGRPPAGSRRHTRLWRRISRVPSR